MSKHAIVVQCFNKLDTLQGVCESLLACSGRHQFDLIFWADSAVGSREPERYMPAAESVRKYLIKFETRYRQEFSSVSIHINEVNHGCYKTCQMALDHAFERHDFVIFTEDDAIFSKDALSWFLICSQNPEFTSEMAWAIGGESIFFDSRRQVVTPEIYEEARAFALNEHLLDKYISVKFIPSTCFATSSKKWQEFRATRGEVNGDVSLCRRCEAEQKLCLLPVIARVCDVGMLHEFGYSVSVHTASGVEEIKNTYLKSNDIATESNIPSKFCRFMGDAGQLFSWYTNLDKFPNLIAEEFDDRTRKLQHESRSTVESVQSKAENSGSFFTKTLEMISHIPAGTFIPENQVCFDDDEINELGGILQRLVYGPSQIRKKLETFGVSLIPCNFYSEIPSQLSLEAFSNDKVRVRYEAIFKESDYLRAFLEELIPFSVDFDPPVTATSGEFFWSNPAFSFSDAMAYYSMIRKLRPKTIIEVGCGWSTLVAQAALSRNAEGTIICIDPYPPDFLYNSAQTQILQKRVQDIDDGFFNAVLSTGDMIFIDSTHTVKHGSDCLSLYLSILPSISYDIYVHCHDIFLPTTLSLEMMRDSQIYWTEQYLLYAYMLNNSKVQTLYGSTYHHEANPELLNALMRGRYGSGGGSLWFLHRA